MERTCDLVSRGSRIKTAEVTAVFTARGVVLFASKESDSDRSELTKQVTDAQLVKAWYKPADNAANAPQVFSAVYKTAT